MYSLGYGPHYLWFVIRCKARAVFISSPKRPAQLWDPVSLSFSRCQGHVGGSGSLREVNSAVNSVLALTMRGVYRHSVKCFHGVHRSTTKLRAWIRRCSRGGLIEHMALKCVMFNLLKPTAYVMHQQFNIQQLYVLSTLYLCVLYLSENKQRLVPLTA